MKFLILSKDYTGKVLVDRLTKENHDVLIVDPNFKSNGISPISNVHMGISHNPDCAILCSNDFITEYHLLHSKNIPTFGINPLGYALDMDNNIARQFCIDNKIRVAKETTKVKYPLSTEIWFAKGNPLYQYLGYIKQTKFLAGDLGLDVDCESVVLWPYQNRDVPAVDRLFGGGLFALLEKIKYTGVMAFDAVISIDDLYPHIKSIKPRIQSPVLLAMLELYKDNFGDLLLSIVQGEQRSILLIDKVAIAVCVSQPAYPYEYSGLIKYLVASDVDWMVARKDIAKQIKQLDIPNIQYRIDAGLQAEHIEDLKKIKYINT